MWRLSKSIILSWVRYHNIRVQTNISNTCKNIELFTASTLRSSKTKLTADCLIQEWFGLPPTFVRYSSCRLEFPYPCVHQINETLRTKPTTLLQHHFLDWAFIPHSTFILIYAPFHRSRRPGCTKSGPVQPTWWWKVTLLPIEVTVQFGEICQIWNDNAIYHLAS